MQHKITGLVLNVVKHSDTRNVITLYTRDKGRLSLLSPTGSGKRSRMRNASLQILSLIEADVNIVPTRELATLGQFSMPAIWRDIYFNPLKSTIAIFLSEFLNNLLRTAAPDTPLFDFTARSIALLDATDRPIGNFHIAFLISMLSFSGIQPDTENYDKGTWFDMRAGTFSKFPPPHKDAIQPDEATLIPLLSRMTMANCHKFRFSAEQRRRILQKLLAYYSIHFPGMGNMKSPAILADIFS